MDKRNGVKVPGKVLEKDVIFGLTFNELVFLASVPIVFTLPVVFIQAIPLWIAFIIVLVGSVVMSFIVLKSPEGQKPTEWAPEYFNRIFGPAKYTLKPKQEEIDDDIRYLDVIHTAPKIVNETESASSEDYLRMIQDIDHVEKLEGTEELIETLEQRIDASEEQKENEYEEDDMEKTDDKEQESRECNQIEEREEREEKVAQESEVREDDESHVGSDTSNGSGCSTSETDTTENNSEEKQKKGIMSQLIRKVK